MKILSRQDRNLLGEMVRTDFKLRYQGSWLGYLWSLMKPLLLFIILYVVFTSVFRLGDDVEHYPVYLLFGIVLWTYFTEATTRSLSVIVDRGELIRKIALPRHLFVVATNISALINFAINLLLVFVFMLLLDVPFKTQIIFLPVIFIELFVFTMSCSLLLAALYVKVRDISYIWEVGLQAAFYATPILYPISLIPEKYIALAFTNPMAQIIQDARRLLVSNDAQTVWEVTPSTALISFSILVLIVWVSIIVFRRNQRTFAEDV